MTIRGAATQAAAGLREALLAWTISPPVGPALASRFPRRLGWTARFRPVLPWFLALAVFGIAMASVPATLQVHDLALPFLCALIALPVALAGRYALLGWRLVTLLAVTLALVGTPGTGELAGTWPVVMQWVWLGVTFLVAVRHDRWTTVWVWAVTAAVVSTGADNVGMATTLGVAMSVAVLIGSLVRSRILAGRDLERQTELSELEKARRTVLEERTRIARELHDVVAHHMSMVVVQAESAPYRLSGLTAEATGEFASISQSAREALTEIRALLGVLRSDGDGRPRAPQPGWDDLGGLVAAAVRSGLRVELRTETAARDIGRAVGLSAYRIVQESLANAARHAPGAPVIVTVVYGDEALRLRIVNGAATAPAATLATPSPAGHGLVGMRERAEVVGGTLRAGPRADGGFEVDATLPYHREVIP